MDVTMETDLPVEIGATVDSDIDQLMDDDRSSSLSDIDDESEALNQDTPTNMDREIEEDSEAETDRIEITPNSAGAVKKMMLITRPFEPSPSKLAQTAAIDGENIEDDKLSDSGISSPLDSDRGSLSDELPEVEEDDVDEAEEAAIRLQQENARKRKRSLLDGDELAESVNARARRQRTGSVQSDRSAASDAGSDNASLSSREGTLEPAGTQEQDGEVVADKEDEIEEEPEIESKETKNKAVASRRRALRGKPIDGDAQDEVAEPENQEDAVESDQEEGAENDDIDDAEAAAKSEEEAAKRLAAMESLAALEKHFATLRDRLYDERISSINNELAQLNGSKPSHPELLRQVKIVQKYRDDKFEIEQKLLVHKVGALKRKSVAERAQIHSAYFQTVRDLRERHLEKISEHFYRIQRDRFKTESPITNYTIPFPKDRLQQVSHQVAYNKEVSILSGVAKYVGFPAAPDLSGLRPNELDEDMEKMGITLSRTKNARRTQPGQNSFHATISRPGAEEQFLEQTPWANPQHPISQQLQRLSRQASEQGRVQETPAGQQRLGESTAPQGSASTIALDQSAQASSAFNTPFGDQVSHAPMENGDSQSNYRLSTSPTESRKTNIMQKIEEPRENNEMSEPQQDSMASSPLLARPVPPPSVSPILGPSHDERIPRHENNASPLGLHRPNAGIVAGTGMGRFGMR